MGSIKITWSWPSWNRAIAEGRATRWSWLDEFGRTQFSYGAYDTAEIAAREVRNWPLRANETIEIIDPKLAQLKGATP